MKLIANNIHKNIKGKTILNDISLEMETGNIYGFWGRNGSGKTMLFRALSGLMKIDSGNIYWNDKELHKDFAVLPSQGIVLEHAGLYPNKTGAENLLYLAQLKGVIGKREVEEAIQRVGLDPADKRVFGKYSMGMKQRLVIAQAIMEKPDVIMLDEPTIGLDEAKTVGDCTCGSASMLLEVKKHLSSGKVGHFYGQENNASTYNLARMNMLMHDIEYQRFDIYKGDTLKNDCYGDVKMTVQVCNPPYSLKWSADKSFEEDPRYSGAGKLAPKSHADFAFLEHMIYHMDPDDGRIAVLLPHGVLFRGGAEEVIRKYIVKDLNKLDAVIGLPANLFHGTSIPVCLLVLKSKRNGNSGNILFIDASKEFTSGKNQNTLEDKHIEKIVNAYKERKDIDKFCHVALMEEIEENGYNMNIPRYVDTFEPEPEIDLNEVAAEIRKLQAEIKDIDAQLKPYFDELGLDFPFGEEGK